MVELARTMQETGSANASDLVLRPEGCKVIPEVLQQQNARMQMMLKAYTQILEKGATAEPLLRLFTQAIEEDLGMDRVVFLLLDEGEWKVMLNANVSYEAVRAIDIPHDLYPFRRTTVITSKKNDALREIDVVIPIVQNGDPQGFILLGDTNDLGVLLRGTAELYPHGSADTGGGTPPAAIDGYTPATHADPAGEESTTYPGYRGGYELPALFRGGGRLF